MRPGLQTPASVNVTSLPSSALTWACATSKHRWPISLYGRGNWMLRLWGRPSADTPMDANLLLELTREADCDSDSGA